MDEKTIEEILYNLIDLAKREYQDEVLIGNLHLKAIKNLWEIYNKEKEKNIPLIIDEKSINKYADELEDLLKIQDGTPTYFTIKEREAIKILNHYIRQSLPKSEIKENYISKDKIRFKIEEVKQMENVGIQDILESQKDFCIDRLEELLEE